MDNKLFGQNIRKNAKQLKNKGNFLKSIYNTISTNFLKIQIFSKDALSLINFRSSLDFYKKEIRYKKWTHNYNF